MVLADSSYPVGSVFVTLLELFAFVIWFWILISVFADLFRRHDIGGFAKVLWFIFVIVLPFLGVFIYIIVEHKGMTERTIEQQKAAQGQFDDYVKSVAAQSDPTEKIAKAKQLLDSGAINQAEFDDMKKKALAAT